MSIQGAPVVFIGDSITFAWRDLRGPQLLNRGVPGETTIQMHQRLARQLAEVTAGGLHVLGGVNDIAGNGGAVSLAQTRTNLRMLAESGVKRGLKVWVGSVTPASHIWWNPAAIDVAKRIRALNIWIEVDARALGCVFIDYHRALADARGGLSPEYGYDGLHLNAAGYGVMTRMAKDALGSAWPVDSTDFSG